MQKTKARGLPAPNHLEFWLQSSEKNRGMLSYIINLWLPIESIFLLVSTKGQDIYNSGTGYMSAVTSLKTRRDSNLLKLLSFRLKELIFLDTPGMRILL